MNAHRHLNFNDQSAPDQCDQKKSPNLFKSWPKMISLEKWYISTSLQKLPKNVERFGQINCCKRLQKVAQSPINWPIYSHCSWPTIATILATTWFNWPKFWVSYMTITITKMSKMSYWSRYRCGHQHLLHCVIHPQLTNLTILQHGSIHYAMTLVSERCALKLRNLGKTF